MLTRLMERLHIERAKFVAHDHGGAVALLMMDRDADKMERLVLTNIEAYDQRPSQPELKYLRAIVNRQPHCLHRTQVPLGSPPHLPHRRARREDAEP